MKIKNRAMNIVDNIKIYEKRCVRIPQLTIERFRDVSKPCNSFILYNSLIYFFQRAQGLKFKPFRPKLSTLSVYLAEYCRTKILI